MGISRDSRHKRRLTGGRVAIHKKKRAYEAARPSANTKLGDKKIKKIRVRGGNFKFRALRINVGNFNWPSEGIALKSKVQNVVYNASNNEYVRTNTLVKNTIVKIDSTPFRKFIAKHYLNSEEDQNINYTWESRDALKKANQGDKATKFLKRRVDHKIDPRIQDQLTKGHILACISSRPGQSGRCDGYLLEGKELEFYLKKMEKK